MKKLFFTCSMLFVSLLANAYDALIDGIYYNLNVETKQAEVTYGDNQSGTYAGSITLPAAVVYEDKAYLVTAIGECAFYECNNLSSIAIPETVVSIDDFAFYGCNSLSAIAIPDGVISIGFSAFNTCGALTTVVLPYSVKYMAGFVFANCDNLTSVTIGAGLASLGDTPFANNSKLVSIAVDKENKVYDSREDCNAIIETSSNTLVAGCQSTVIPSSVTAIGEVAFVNCSNLSAITIPESVVSIGDNAFYKCNELASIKLGAGLASIGSHTFLACINLASITVDKGNRVYDSREDCNAIIETASNRLVVGCQSTVIPSSVTDVDDSAFLRCSNLSTITIPEGVTSIGSEAFAWCDSLVSITVDKGNKVYDSREDCNAIIETASNRLVVGCQSTVIPSSVTAIGDNAFEGSSKLTSIAIPNNVTTLGESAFLGCENLTSVTLDTGLDSIGEKAFMFCGNLREVHCYATEVPAADENSFPRTISSATLYVPSRSIEAYKSVAPWNMFGFVKALPNNSTNAIK